MATTRTRPVPPPAAKTRAAAAPRVVFFGMPGSGKTSLIGAFVRQAATAAGGDAVRLETAEPQSSIRRELVPHTIQIGTDPSGTLVLYDCDGKAAGELLSHPDRFVRGAARGALAAAIRSADALVLTVDAAETEAEDVRTFENFRQFLDGLEAGRAFGREVGGLPVFLTLTKCDTLHRSGDRPGEWMARVSRRAEELRERFEGYFGEHLADEELAPYLPFGSIDLDVVWTATGVPEGRAFAAYANPDGAFGVARLVRRVAPAAQAYRSRLHAARRRLRFTIAGAGVLLGTMILGLIILAATGRYGPTDLLAERVRTYQQNEPSAAVRLADRHFARNLLELNGLRKSPGFDRLPEELRNFVTGRIQEFEAYRDYRRRFRPPRLGPAEVRTREQVEELEATLHGELAPPIAHAAAWTETEAVRLWRKWQADLTLLREAESRLNEWYRGLIRRANQLLLTERSPDYGWRGQVMVLLQDAERPPFQPDHEIDASQSVPVSRGRKLTYAPAFAHERVDQARRDWSDTQTRLSHLRDLTDALGLTNGPGTPPGVLDLPEPSADATGSRELAGARLLALRSTFPAASYLSDEYPEWSVNNYPDPVRQAVQIRLRNLFETGVRHVRRLIQPAVASVESLENWRRLADGLLQEEALKSWGRLLRLYRMWSDPIPAPTDPVQDLVDFLRRDRVTVSMKVIAIAIPDDLLDQRLLPSGRFVLRLSPAGGTGMDLAYRQEGEGRRDRPVTVYTFVPEGHTGMFTVHPGDAVTATLSVRAGIEDYRLVWTGGRSAVYQLDNLAQPPRHERIGPLPSPASAQGVRLTASPPGGLPAVPVLLPDLRPNVQ